MGSKLNPEEILGNWSALTDPSTFNQMICSVHQKNLFLEWQQQHHGRIYINCQAARLVWCYISIVPQEILKKRRHSFILIISLRTQRLSVSTIRGMMMPVDVGELSSDGNVLELGFGNCYTPTTKNQWTVHLQWMKVTLFTLYPNKSC